MTKNDKEEFVSMMTEKLKKASTIIIMDYRGLKVSQDTNLRKKMRESGVEYVVAKNRLMKIAMQNAGINENFDDMLEGTNSFAIGYEDLVAPAKVAYDFSKEFKVLNIKAGCLEGKRISALEVEALASLPSKEVLLSKLLAGMQAPLSGLANVMQGTIRKFVYALDAVAKQK